MSPPKGSSKGTAPTPRKSQRTGKGGSRTGKGSKGDQHRHRVQNKGEVTAKASTQQRDGDYAGEREQKLERQSKMTKSLRPDLYQDLLDVFSRGLARFWRPSSAAKSGLEPNLRRKCSWAEEPKCCSSKHPSVPKSLFSPGDVILPSEEADSNCGYRSESSSGLDTSSGVISTPSTPPSSNSTASLNRSGHPEMQPSLATSPQPPDTQSRCISPVPPHSELSPAHVSASFEDTLQTIKTHLFARDFESAFGKPEHLPVYAARWSAARALGYASVLAELGEELGLTGPDDTEGGERARKDDLDGKHHRNGRKVVLCIGAGSGSEYVGFAGWIRNEGEKRKRRMEMGGSGEKEEEEEHEEAERRDGQSRKRGHANLPHLDLQLVDLAVWDCVLASLQGGIESVFGGNDDTLVLNNLTYAFHQANVLNPDSSASSPSLPVFLSTTPPPSLITICFTLNELFAASKGQTTRFLLDISRSVEHGARLLVIDSPGSYGVVAVGKGTKEGGETAIGKEKEERRGYRIGWMLDYILLDLAPKVMSSSSSFSSSSLEASRRRPDNFQETNSGPLLPPVWEKIRTEESRWFRVPEGLDYGTVPVENMRMQVHVYKRC